MRLPKATSLHAQVFGLVVVTVAATAFMTAGGHSEGEARGRATGLTAGKDVAAAGVPSAAAQVGDKDAAAVFRSDCAVCHGTDGLGTIRAPTLAGVGRGGVDFMLSTGRMPLVEAGRRTVKNQPVTPLPNISPADPNLVLGRNKPAYEKPMTDALATYVSNLTGGGPDIPIVSGGQVAQGGVLYRQQCAACHSWSGDGGALLHREAPSLHQATPVQTAEALRLGPGQMPRFSSAALTDNQVADVATYVDYLRNPDDRGGQGLGHIGPVAEGAVALLGIAALLFFVRWIGDRA